MPRRKRVTKIPDYAKLPNETKAAFSAFVGFRTLEPDERSLEILSERRKTPMIKLFQWYEEYEWERRVKAWDFESEKIRRNKALKKVRLMDEAHAALGEKCTQVVCKEVGKLFRKAEQYTDENIMSVSDMVKLGKYGMELERVARGEPVEIVEERSDSEHTTDLSNLTTEEIYDLQRLQNKTRKK